MSEVKKGVYPLQRIWATVLLALVLVLQSVAGAGVAQAAESEGGSTVRAQVKEAIASLRTSLAKQQPVSDWAAFTLARSGMPLGAEYVAEAEKRASELRLATDYARVALAVHANGGDVSKFGAAGTDLLKQLSNFDKMTAQGPNAPAFALLAYDAAGYEPGLQDRWTRDALIAWLVDNRNADHGWSLVSGKSDVDVTAIVLTALAPYQDRETVTKAVEEALAWLSGVQLQTGGFGNPEVSESTAQVLIALTSLGIDPLSDARFIKQDHTTIARLLAFRLADGGFAHTIGGKADGIAAFNALQGLIAVDRLWEGLPRLYDGIGAGLAVDVTVAGVSGTLATGVANGKTALEAFTNVLKHNGIAYQVDNHPQFGPFLVSVGTLASASFGGYDGWQFGVQRNGEWVVIMEGMGSFALQAGDKLHVYYGDSDTRLVHAVTFDPAEPRDNQSVTVKVEQEHYDWETGEVVVSPAVGAVVRAGGKTVKTDEAGKAVLGTLKAGNLPVTVDGYRQGKTPTLVAWQSSIEVAAYQKQSTVRVEGDAGHLAQGKSTGGTALEAVKGLLKDRVDVQELSFGAYIHAIDGIEAGKYGGYDGWLYAVVRDGAWIIPAEGIGTFELADGDEVVVYYSGDNTKLVDQVVVKPAGARPDQDVAVSVTYRDWNWEKNEFDPAQPLAGATVAVGSAKATTNDAGEAVLKGLKEGLHTLEVTGYAEDGGPTVVRQAIVLPIAGSYADEAKVSKWAADAVHTARAAGILNGLLDGKKDFAPQQAATRAEFVSALVRALGLNGAGSLMFKDVPADAWYAKDIGIAAAAGLTNGVAPDKFAPDASLTREQAAILLVRALKLKATTQTALKDAGSISANALEAVQAALSSGWMVGYDGNFMPQASLTREQAAVVAVRVLLNR